METYVAQPCSRQKIRKKVNLLKKILGIENELFFDVIKFLDVRLPEIFPDISIIIAEESEMPNCWGLTIPEKNLIKIRQDVYLRAIDGEGRDRFTIMHEIAHFFLHENRTVALARLEKGTNMPAYLDPEWQADAFAGEFLMPANLIKNLSAQEIAEKCGVSISAARIQLKHSRNIQ